MEDNIQASAYHPFLHGVLWNIILDIVLQYGILNDGLSGPVRK